MCEHQNGHRNDAAYGITNQAVHRESATDQRIIEDHGGASPGDHSRADVAEPPDSVHEVSDHVSREHEDCHAQHETEYEQGDVAFTRAGDPKHVVEPQYEVCQKNSDNRFTHDRRYLD